MTELPDFSKDLLWGINSYLSCDIARISKIIAHYVIFKIVQDIPGAFIECVVFKGGSFSQFDPDKKERERFVAAAGNHSISIDQLWEVPRHKRCEQNVDLVAENICQTVPRYVQEHPEQIISLLNLDTDIYEPAVTVLKNLLLKIEVGGIFLLDDYFKDKRFEIKKKSVLHDALLCGKKMNSYLSVLFGKEAEQ